MNVSNICQWREGTKLNELEGGFYHDNDIIVHNGSSHSTVVHADLGR